MNTRQQNLLLGFFYIFLAFLQTAESILPWIRYCKVEFSFMSIFSVDEGLSIEDKRISNYSAMKENLCKFFKPITETACPKFCNNLDNIQNGGLLMFSCNLVCIILSIFLAYHYISKSCNQFEGRIPPIALWTLTIIKIFLGVIYFKIIDPSSIPTTWEVGYDVRLSFGVYLYALDVFSQISVSYLVYTTESRHLRTPSESKLGT